MSRVTEEVRNEYENRQGVYTPGPLALRGVEEYEGYLDDYLRQLSGNPHPDWVKLFNSTSKLDVAGSYWLGDFRLRNQIENVFRLNEDIFEKFEFLSDGLEAFLRVLDEFAKANPEKLLACLTDLTFFIGLINGAKQMQLYLDPENRSGSLHGEPLFKKTVTVLQQGARQLVLQLVGDVMFFRSETNRLPDVSLGDL